MLEPILFDSKIDLKFDRENLTKLSKYFDSDFLDSSLDEKILFFTNLQRLSQRSLGLAHNIQHHATSIVSIQLSSSDKIKQYINQQPYGQLIGCSSQIKSSDSISLINNTLNGEKKWLSNLDIADYAVIQIEQDQRPYVVYVDLHTVPHEVNFSFFTPIGMEMSRPGNITFNNQPIDPDCVLGIKGTQEFFQQSNFGSQCFLTNHLGITKQLFLDIKQYAEKNNCGAKFEIAKLEIDVCTLEMMWSDNLYTIHETILTNEFWNKRNTQYAFSKKTLINVIKLILELGVSYYTDAHSEFSQRFRDALTYSSHMHPLYRFGQEFHMLDLTKNYND
jgi:hypothetical protein